MNINTPSNTSGSCPLCHSKKTGVHWQTNDQEGEYCSVSRCTACHTLFLYPLPDSDRLSRAYSAQYYGGEEQQTKFRPWMERLRDYSAITRARQLTRLIPKNACIVDIGCGDGRFLRAFLNLGNYQLHGIEPAGRAADRAARTKEINLHVGTLETSGLPEASCDLVTLIHVFEHLPNPAETLDRVGQLVRPGGSVFISLPNCASWQASIFKGNWFHLDPPRHLTLIPPQTLTRKFEQMGFSCRAVAHLNWEQNIYGWIQSALNLTHAKRNLLYEFLKRNRAYTADTNITVAIHLVTATLLAPASILLDILAAILKRGATTELFYTKNLRT